MKKYVLVLLILLIAIVINACQKEENKTLVDEAEKKYEPKLIQETMNDPRINTSWTKISEFNLDLDIDLNIDGKEDYIGLYTTAEPDKSGELMWDDGQNWLLLFQSGDKFYLLFSEYVQLGSVYFTVSRCSENSTAKITAIIPTGANLKIVSYSFDKDKKGFIEEPIYSSKEDNLIFTSIPDYR